MVFRSYGLVQSYSLTNSLTHSNYYLKVKCGIKHQSLDTEMGICKKQIGRHKVNFRANGLWLCQKGQTLKPEYKGRFVPNKNIILFSQHLQRRENNRTWKTKAIFHSGPVTHSILLFRFISREKQTTGPVINSDGLTKITGIDLSICPIGERCTAQTVV